AGADHRYPKPVEHRLERIGTSINSTPWLADSLDVTNHPLAIRAVLQVDVQLLAGSVLTVGFVPIPNVAFALQHFRQTTFDFRYRQLYRGPFDPYGVTDASKHIGNRIGHHRVVDSWVN